MSKPKRKPARPRRPGLKRRGTLGTAKPAPGEKPFTHQPAIRYTAR